MGLCPRQSEYAQGNQHRTQHAAHTVALAQQMTTDQGCTGAQTTMSTQAVKKANR